jgi:hypothetical protein
MAASWQMRWQIFYNRHGQFVKDGGAIAFYGGLK